MALSVDKPRSWQQLHAQLSRHLTSVGLDICHAFSVQRYNEHGPASPLPTFNRRCTLAILVGNSQALWPHFVEHLKHTPGALECNDPLDAYTSSKVEACVKDLLDGIGAEVGGSCLGLAASNASFLAHVLDQQCTSALMHARMAVCITKHATSLFIRVQQASACCVMPQRLQPMDVRPRARERC